MLCAAFNPLAEIFASCYSGLSKPHACPTNPIRAEIASKRQRKNLCCDREPTTEVWREAPADGPHNGHQYISALGLNRHAVCGKKGFQTKALVVVAVDYL